MKKVMKWRYYCDHCKKSGGSKYHMKKHESSCVKNPDRYCGFCETSKGSGSVDYLKNMVLYLSENINEIVTPLSFSDNDTAIYELKDDESVLIDKLRDFSDNCPACILAAIAQSGHAYLFEYNFKKEKSIFWDENKSERHWE